MANKRVPFNLQPKVYDEHFFNVLEERTAEIATSHGRECFFLRQSSIKVDDVLLEVQSKSFQFKHMSMMWYLNDEETADMDGSTVYGGFNLIPLYQKVIYIPISFFKKMDYTPVSGDLIYLPERNQEEMLYEITKDPVREQDHSNSKNGRIFQYKLFLKLYSNDRGNVKFEGSKADVDEEFDISDDVLAELEEMANGLDDATSVKESIPSLKRRDEEVKKVQSTKKGRFENL